MVFTFIIICLIIFSAICALIIVISLFIGLFNSLVENNYCFFKGHTWDSWAYVNDTTCEKKESCNKCGKTRGEAHVIHDWHLDYISSDSCLMQEKCSRCGLRQGEMNVQHDWLEHFTNENSNRKEKICNRCKKKSEAWISQPNWPIIFSDNNVKRKYLHLQNSVSGLFQSKGVYYQTNSHMNFSSEISKSQEYLPDTNLLLNGFSFEGLALYFYPDGYMISRDNSNIYFGNYQTHIISMVFSKILFINNFPDDSEVIGHTWLHCCKDGHPDLRYSYNPKCLYGRLFEYSFTADDAHNIRLLFSNFQLANNFQITINTYLLSIGIKNQQERSSERSEKKNSHENTNYRGNDQNRGSTTNKESTKETGKKPSNDDAFVITLANAHEILEINPASTKLEIEEAFKKKALEYHPDRVTGLGKDLQNLAELRMKQINIAHDLLIKKFL